MTYLGVGEEVLELIMTAWADHSFMYNRPEKVTLRRKI